MAAAIVTSTLALTLSALRVKASGLAPPKRPINSGSNFPRASTTITSGTGSQKCNQLYCASRSILTTANDDIDLSGGLTDDDGGTITFTKIKKIIVVVTSPDGAKKLLVGPKAVSNPFVGPWSGGQGATVYDEVYEFAAWINSYTGWAVTAGTGDILRIHNPGLTTVDYTLYLEGEQ